MQAVMMNWEARYEQAHRHVRDGRRVIARQRDIIDRQKVLGVSTEAAEQLLANFARSQAIFEDDLAAIIEEKQARI